MKKCPQCGSVQKWQFINGKLRYFCKKCKLWRVL